jgi:molecular chaperone GrpE
MTKNDQEEDTVFIDSSEHDNEDTHNNESEVILKALQTEIETLKDKLLRIAAELENTRKRADKQIQEAQEYATTSFAKDLIGVTDNLERALQYRPENITDELKNLIQGTEMIYAELKNVLTKHHITKLETSIGDKFDYNIHQAISQIQTNEYPKGSIVDIMQIGYKLKDRLLRPAIVAISDSCGESSPKNQDEK